MWGGRVKPGKGETGSRAPKRWEQAGVDGLVRAEELNCHPVYEENKMSVGCGIGVRIVRMCDSKRRSC